jgi:hypothetical protein
MRLLRFAVCAAAAAGALAAPPAAAQDTQPAPVVLTKPVTPGINYRERPRYPFDPQRLKRRPVLDGVIGDSEWDPLYTIGDGAVKGTVYLNWDDDFLYVAARTDQSAWVVLDLDANADGWLRGADNLELTVAPAGMDGVPALTARILDAAGNKDAPVWNEKVVDPRSIQLVEKMTGGAQVIEMAIPKGIAGLSLRPNATLSVRADFLPSGPAPTPTAPYEPHLLVDITLVEARTVAAPGITPRLTLDDSKVIPGQSLRATLELMNQTEEESRVRFITWQGDAAAADLLRLERDPNVPPIKGLKTLKRKYSSTLPETAVPGFYQLTATAQLENGRTVSSTISFSVVEPFSLQMSVEPDPINVLGPTQVKAFVDITSAVPGMAKGSVELQAPAGWEIKGRSKKEFLIQHEDSTGRSVFYLTLPSTTQAGDYIFNAAISWHGKTWKAHTTVHVNRAAETTETPKKGP